MRVLLADDHMLFMSGLKNLLTASGITVVGMARTGDEAVSKARSLRPDVILMDIQMPSRDGLTSARLIKQELPEIKIVILTMTEDDKLLLEAIKSGVSGFLLKNLDTDEFLQLLNNLDKGETVFSPGLADRLIKEFLIVHDTKETGMAEKKTGPIQRPLTKRQQAVLRLVAEGLLYKEVAAVLSVSEATVKYHMSEILNRLNLENRTQAIAYAVQAKLTGVSKQGKK